MTSEPKLMDATDWTLLMLLSVLWGGAFFFAGVAVRELPPMTVVLARVMLAAAILLPLFWYFGHSLPRGLKAWTPFLVMGLLNNALPFGFIFAGQTYVTVGLAAIVNAMTPLFTVLVMAAAREERLGPMRLTGVLLDLIGVAILRGIEGAGTAQSIGMALCMAGALSYGFAALWGRRHLAAVPPLRSATCQLLSSTLIMSAAVALHDRPWALDPPGAATLLSLLGLALLGTAVAYIVFFTILVRAGASNVMLVTLLIPVSAMALEHAFLDQPIRAQEIAGALVIGLGLLFVDGRVPRRLARGRASAHRAAVRPPRCGWRPGRRG